MLVFDYNRERKRTLKRCFEHSEEGNMETKDLIVIGGGINGAGIAADAAGRGLSVLLLEAQ
ncbi:FAD-dependent oxidoreductase, partial [Yersinia pestis]|uniref:FAD-dependent oxidoreductase n=1 Tax=Yersinia pestis TaxID=632 RepID=UPI003082E227